MTVMKVTDGESLKGKLIFGVRAVHTFRMGRTQWRGIHVSVSWCTRRERDSAAQKRGVSTLPGGGVGACLSQRFGGGLWET